MHQRLEFLPTHFAVMTLLQHWRRRRGWSLWESNQEITLVGQSTTRLNTNRELTWLAIASCQFAKAFLFKKQVVAITFMISSLRGKKAKAGFEPGTS